MATDDDVAELLERFVNGLDGLPGVDLPPACDGELLFSAMDQMGIFIPPEFALISALSDGMTLDHGQLQLLSFEPDDPLSFVRFNDPTSWHWAYVDIHPGLTDFVYWGITHDHTLLGWPRDQLLTRLERPVRTHVVMPGTAPRKSPYPGSLDTGRNALVWLQDHTEQLRTSGQLNLHPDDQAIYDRFGPLPRGAVVMPGALRLLGQLESLEGAQVMDATTALIAAGELTTEHWRIGEHAERTGETTDIHGIEPWTDELGRVRLRWVTSPS